MSLELHQTSNIFDTGPALELVVLDHSLNLTLNFSLPRLIVKELVVGGRLEDVWVLLKKTREVSRTMRHSFRRSWIRHDLCYIGVDRLHRYLPQVFEGGLGCAANGHNGSDFTTFIAL